MAQTPEQNRRYQAALRRVLARLRAEQPDTYRAWLDEALAEVNGQADEERESALPKVNAEMAAEMERRRAAQHDRTVDRIMPKRREPERPPRPDKKKRRWNGWAWVEA